MGRPAERAIPAAPQKARPRPSISMRESAYGSESTVPGLPRKVYGSRFGWNDWRLPENLAWRASLAGVVAQLESRSDFLTKTFKDDKSNPGRYEGYSEVPQRENVCESEGPSLSASTADGEFSHQQIGIEEKNDEGYLDKRPEDRTITRGHLATLAAHQAPLRSNRVRTIQLPASCEVCRFRKQSGYGPAST